MILSFSKVTIFFQNNISTFVDFLFRKDLELGKLYTT